MHAAGLVERCDNQLTIELRRSHLRIDRRCRLRLCTEIPFAGVARGAREVVAQRWCRHRYSYRRRDKVCGLITAQIEEVRPRRREDEIRILDRYRVVTARRETRKCIVAASVCLRHPRNWTRARDRYVRQRLVAGVCDLSRD